jgi:hypothetical protein
MRKKDWTNCFETYEQALESVLLESLNLIK